ncbi:MAG: glycoside hydrolase family 3 protein, partial [Chitinophagaceae bacterium]
LQTILREKWGFKYLVVSDCGAITDFFTSHKTSSDAVHAAAKGVLSGTDVECVWEGYAYANLPEAVAKGLLTVAQVDEHLVKVLSGRFDLGDMDDDSLVPWANIPKSVLNNAAHRKLALDMARECMTLLRNEGTVLPLKKSGKKIAVVGPNADSAPVLWGNYNGTPVRTITILDGLQSALGKKNIIYDKACDLVENKVTESYFRQASFNGKQGFLATYWNNRDMSGEPVITQQVSSALKLTTAGQHEFASGVQLERFSATYQTEFTATATEEIVFKFGATGSFKLLVNDSLLQSFNNWRTLPSRISFHTERGKKYRVEIRYAQLNNWQANIEFDFGKEVDIDFSGLIKRLQGTDVVVFAGGLSTTLEGEEMPVNYPGFKGGDRTDIQLPEVQRNCLRALKAAGKKVIFVNCSGSAIGLVPETESCDAILQAWYGGESGGQAIAEVLVGDYNPSGKLPITFYKDSTQLGDFENYTMNGRTYRFLQSEPLYPFGFGLSYTHFTIGNAKADKETLGGNDSLQLMIPVSNTGQRSGTEVVQVYIHKTGDDKGPIKTLRAFTKINVAGGKTATAVIKLKREDFEFYNEAIYDMDITPGSYELWYGNSSANADLKKLTITIAK